MQSFPRCSLLHVALGLGLAITCASACALVVPPSWRSEFDIGLFGPIDGRKRGPEAPDHSLSDPSQGEDTGPLDSSERRLRAQQLAHAVELDRESLLDLVADPVAVERSPADDPELRRIVERLPELQEELRSLERSLGIEDKAPLDSERSRGLP